MLEKKETIIGAVVGLKGIKGGDVTDIEGNYAVKVLPTDTLDVTSVGYYRTNVNSQRALG